MPLLDHKYEVLRQSALDGRQTLFEATAPDGTAVSIVWFELENPQEELLFERYRQLLRALRARGFAAIYDLVSRPGAHYVAWHAGGASAGPAPGQGSEAISGLLADYGYGPQAAELRLDANKCLKVYGLSFDGSQSGLAAVPPRRYEPGAAAAPAGTTGPQLPSWLYAWLPGAVLALAGVLLLSAGLGRQAENRVITVPPLLGAGVNEAAERLYDLGLQVTTEAVPSEAKPGQVLGLDPGVGSRLRPGRHIRLRYAVAAGQLPSVAVPDLVGQSYRSGQAAGLLPEGLALGHVARIPSSTPQGIILAQSVPPGSKPPGGVVDLLISSGPRTPRTFLPELAGLELRVAIDLARDAGFSAIEEEYVPDSRAPVGTVIAQNIAPHTYVPQGTTLRLSVSGSETPPEPTGRLVPDLILMSKAEARRTLEEARFKLGASKEVHLPGLPEGVIEQDPAPGAAPRGNTVDITLNTKPRVSYALTIEPGIPATTAELYATTASGKKYLLQRRQVQGGDVLRGSWLPGEPGPVKLELLLNGFPYRELEVTP